MDFRKIDPRGRCRRRNLARRLSQADSGRTGHERLRAGIRGQNGITGRQRTRPFKVNYRRLNPAPVIDNY